MSTHTAKIDYDEGHVYNGQWSKEGKREGRGFLCLSDGTEYRGEFSNGFYGGHGVLSFPDGSWYEGSFELGKFHGYGVFRNKQGMIFEGQFKNGECNGPALITLPDGSHGNPRCEGVYRGSVCERRCEAGDAVRRARQAQNISRTISTDLSSQ